MELAKMTEEELRLYKQETLRRLADIYHDEGHHLVAFTTEDGCAIMVDQVTGRTMFSYGGKNDDKSK